MGSYRIFLLFLNQRKIMYARMALVGLFFSCIITGALSEKVSQSSVQRIVDSMTRQTDALKSQFAQLVDQSKKQTEAMKSFFAQFLERSHLVVNIALGSPDIITDTKKAVGQTPLEGDNDEDNNGEDAGDDAIDGDNDDDGNGKSKNQLPPGGVSFNGSYFYIIPDNKTTWYKARRNCQDRGGDLAVLNSKTKFDFITNSTLLKQEKIAKDSKVIRYDQLSLWVGATNPIATKDYDDCNSKESCWKNGWKWLSG